MLIIGMSNRHAAAILDFVERHFPQYTSARIGQDVPAAERLELLEAYRNGDIDVMVQVDMIGEGTDIKPISVIVKADLVRAYSKTIQQIFRGMRWFDDFSEENNVCDIYAADDSEVVEVLDFITSEEQIGIRMKQKRNGEAPPPGSSEASKWELTEVHHRHLQTHNLELFPEYVQQSQDAEPVASKPVTVDPSPKPDPAPEVLDVNQQEKDLRKACASLAAQLAHASRSIGRPVEIRTVHAEWKRRYSRGQDNLSVVELQRKRDWLEKCLTAGRIV